MWVSLSLRFQVYIEVPTFVWLLRNIFPNGGHEERTLNLKLFSPSHWNSWLLVGALGARARPPMASNHAAPPPATSGLMNKRSAFRPANQQIEGLEAPLKRSFWHQQLSNSTAPVFLASYVLCRRMSRR